MEFLAMVFGLAVTGFLIGVCSGLLGIGGGTVMIPLLRLVFGLDAYMATATSLFTIIPTSLSGAVSHVRNRTCYWQLGVALGAGGAITSGVGVYLASISPSVMIIGAAAVVIFYSAYSMIRKAMRKAPRSSSTQDAPEPVMSRRTLAAGFAIGLVTGLCAGYVGVGGGFIMVPLMTAWLGVSMKKASGTSIVAMIILSIPGVIGQILLGHVDYLVGIMLAAGSIPGAFVGAKLVTRVSERQLRFIFAGFLIAAGILLVINEFEIL